jgi:hypothetical protein
MLRFTHSPIASQDAERGQTLPIVVLFMVVLILISGAVIDLGNAYRVRQQRRAAA